MRLEITDAAITDALDRDNAYERERYGRESDLYYYSIQIHSDGTAELYTTKSSGHIGNESITVNQLEERR